MYISRLELKGFKSFADKTTIRLSPGLSVITGPNGSGKSNLIDAVRFVMGENSTRALRADKLASLISDGARGKGQKYYVRMVIDNSDRGIPMNEDELVVTRYLDERGESKYFLNRRRAQRSVVMNVLSMAGLSSRGYNIVVQGEISRISEKSPEEIRGMIEEAVGISSFDERKKQAEGELKEAETNMRVAMSRLEEVRSNIEQLERDMNRAMASVTLREMTEELKRYMLSNRLSSLEPRLQEALNYISELSANAGGIEDERRKATEGRKALVDAILKLDAAAEDTSKMSSSELAETLTNETAELARLEYGLQQWKESKRRLSAEIGERRQLRRKTSSAIRYLRRRRRAAVANIRVLGLRIEKSSSVRDRIKRIADKARKDGESSQKTLEEVEAALQALKLDAAQTEFELRRIDEQIGELERSEIAAAEKRRLHVKKYLRSRMKVERLNARLGTMTKEAQTFGEILAQSLSKAERLEKGEMTVRELMSKLEAAAERVRGKLENTFGLNASDPRYVALVLKEAGISVPGLLRELISYPPDLEPAMNATLGDWLDAIVIGKEEDTSAILISLLNIGIDSAWLVREGEPQEAGRETGDRLIDHIQFPPELGEFLLSRVGEFALVGDATQAGVAFQRGLSVVTKEGLVLRSGGFGGVHGAPRISASSLMDTLKALEADLSEARRIREEILHKSITDLKQSISKAGSWLERTVRVRKAASRLLDDLTNRMKAEESLLLVEEEKAKGIKARLLQAKKRGGEMRERLENLRRQLSHSLRERRTVRSRVSQAFALLSSSERRLANFDAEIKGATQAVEASKRRVAEIDRQLELSVRNRASTVARILEIASAMKDADLKLKELTEARAKLDAEIGQVQAKLRESTTKPETDERRDQLAEEMQKAEDAIEGLDARLRESQNKIGDAQLKKYEVEKEISSVREKMSALGAPKLPNLEGLETALCESLAKELEGELVGMGALNMLAGQHYDQYSRNYILISQRLNTLEEEKKAILDLISEIEMTKKQAFLQALETVNKTFGDYFADVTSGSARLECERPDDPFQGGLSIMVRFPGKETRLVYGSSGGEKSVTALCLIFALQQLKPAPFYFFDEIDAHLDARNVQNYLKLVSMRATGSQLLMISLKDVVAFGADKLIGTYIKGGRSKAMEMPIVVGQKVRK